MGALSTLADSPSLRMMCQEFEGLTDTLVRRKGAAPCVEVSVVLRGLGPSILITENLCLMGVPPDFCLAPLPSLQSSIRGVKTCRGHDVHLLGFIYHIVSNGWPQMQLDGLLEALWLPRTAMELLP